MCLLYFARLMVILLNGVAHAEDPLCEPGEYLINEICCPMCDSGNRVQKPCTATASGATSCIPCMPGTYMDHPSGLTECFKCKSCDPGSGLRMKSVCTYTKNTVCSCMDGHYCLKSATEDCDLCEKHTVCDLGERVKVHGTERTNTVCEKCPDGTFSNKSMSNSCIVWTSCHDLGRNEKKRGTDSEDVECGEPIRTREGLIAATVVVIVVVIIAIICGCRKERNKMDDKTTTGKQPAIPGQDTHDPEPACNTTDSMLPEGTTTSSDQDDKTSTENEPDNNHPVQETQPPDTACDTPASVHYQSTTAASSDQVEIH